MAKGKPQKYSRLLRRGRLALAVALASFVCACAAATSPNPAGPNPNAPPYPVLLVDEDEVRREAALDAWAGLLREQGVQNGPTAPELQPVTATIAGLPQLPSPLYLPKVGAETTMTEEETRESLRRFVNDNRVLLGIDPLQLSLVGRVDAADGSKRARYEQRPFRYPFRNGFGVLEITFAPDRRILNINSTTIPDIDRLRERLRASGTGITPRAELATPDLVIKSMQGRTITYLDAAGRTSTYTLTPQNRITPREFVAYPLLRRTEPPALEFHLAWEIAVEGAPFRLLYLDAITGDVVAAS